MRNWLCGSMCVYVYVRRICIYRIFILPESDENLQMRSMPIRNRDAYKGLISSIVYIYIYIGIVILCEIASNTYLNVFCYNDVNNLVWIIFLFPILICT